MQLPKNFVKSAFMEHLKCPWMLLFEAEGSLVFLYLALDPCLLGGD